LGGAKGGVQVDAKRLSMREREGLSRAYIRAFAAFMGPDRDIPAPDMYTDERVMAWMADEYDTIVGRHVPDAVTGKPVILGGIAGRIEATARGGVEVLQGLEDALGLKPRDTRAVVQGFGNVGYHAARLLCDAGYVVAGISDSAGAVYDADGLDPEAVMQHKRGTGSVGGAPGLSHEDLLEQEYELLVPAATADSLTADNVGRIKAKAVLELANGAVTPNADETLQARGVTVIPDVLANVGGVTVSSYELIQNRSGDPWSRDRVHERLRRQMQEAAEDVLRTSRDAKIALRCAAYVRALHRIAHAVETYGTRCNDFGGRPKS
jgi:glutamate dehydrogenase (NADP+)